MHLPDIPLATVLSIVSLVFAFGTTFVTYRRTHAQDIQSERQQLRTILQRLSAIPRENIEINKKYADDQGTIFGFGQLYNQENTMLARQAAEIARHLPPNVVSATEFYAIATALQRAYDLGEAKVFIEFAAERATGFNDKIGALRFGASLDYVAGHPGDGRVKFQEALNIFTSYREFDPYTQASTHIFTELQWAGCEAGILQMPLAFEHLAKAQQIADAMPPSPGRESLKAQIAQTRAQFTQNQPQPPATGTPPNSPTPRVPMSRF